MFKNKHGFTLLELIIAAAIIGVLAVFATQSFRQTGSDIRVENAKAKAKVIAMAARNFMDDNSAAAFSSNDLVDLDPNTLPECSDITSFTLETLIGCGYLENRKYLDNDFTYEFSTNASNEVVVCMSKNASGSRAFNFTGTYCTNGED